MAIVTLIITRFTPCKANKPRQTELIVINRYKAW